MFITEQNLLRLRFRLTIEPDEAKMIVFSVKRINTVCQSTLKKDPTPETRYRGYKMRYYRTSYQYTSAAASFDIELFFETICIIRRQTKQTPQKLIFFHSKQIFWSTRGSTQNQIGVLK
jgi:hypothetical protein